MAAVITDPDETAYTGLEDADRRTDRVPVLIERLRSDHLPTALKSVELLHDTVWRGGTVFEVTPSVVPSIVDVVVDRRRPDRVRTLSAFLLAAIAAADSFVLAHDQTRRPAWWAAPRPPGRAPDLARRCRTGVEEDCGRLLGALDGATPLLVCGLVAVAGAAHRGVGANAIAVLSAARRTRDTRLGAAGRLVTELVDSDGAVPAYAVLRAARTDPRTADHLAALGDLPVAERAIRVADHLSSMVARSLLP